MIRPSGNVSSVNGSTNFVDGKYYHFYDIMRTNGVPGFYQELLTKATKTIVIWDSHHCNVDVALFSVLRQNGIYVEVLTMCEKGEAKNELAAFANDVMNAINDVDVPTCQVVVYALLPKMLRQIKGNEWHDRYLIIDSTDVYLVGASIDAQNYSKKSFGIYQLTETDDINLVLKLYEAYRDSIKDVSGGARGNGYKCSVSR